MSHYIHSFLIEPVVRQARRFSRPNNEPYIAQGEAEDDSLQNAGNLASAATAAQEADHSLILEFHDNAISIIADGHTERAESPMSLDDTERGELHVRQDEHDVSLQIRASEASSLPPTIAPRLDAWQERDETSVNPVYGAQRFRSPASSLSSSRSLLDTNMSPAEGVVQSPRLDGVDQRTRGNSGDSRLLGESALPADDGMGPMRRRILAIQRADSSNDVKARLVHDLMVENHNTSHQTWGGIGMARAHSPVSTQSSERPFTPSSPKSTDSLRQTASPPTSSGSSNNTANPLLLTSEDLTPTYYVRPLPIRKDGDQERRPSDENDEPSDLGCIHYKRNIKLQCSACSRWYTCRFCHDAAEDHMLNRKETKSMLCMLCGCAQPASEACTSCGERGAWYYCDVCKLWDDDPHKSIYHCSDCGICRVGQGLGKDFFHCKTCCVCMSISIRDTHRCIERSTDCDCPICGDYMFTSPQTVVFMRCGHSIHHRCYNEHMKSSYRCPICSRSIVNMEFQFSCLSSAIEAQPMPEEFRDTKAWVYCNDCSAKTSVRYHWLGLKCAVCDSYNTAQLSILSGPDPTGADFAEAPSAIGAPSSVPMDSTAPHSRPHSPHRGRLRHFHHHQLTLSRSGNSAPPSAAASLTGHHATMTSSRTLSATPGNPTATSFPFSPSPSPEDSASESSDVDDSMDDYDDVDFWGGESPSARQTSPLAAQRDEGVEGHEMAIDGEESEDGEDSEDGVMVNGEEDDDDDDDDEGPSGPMEMDLIGHR